MPDIDTLVEVHWEPDRIVVEPTVDPGDVSFLVVVAVAAVEGTDPERLPPLYDSVDPDALDAVLDTAGDGAGMNVSFEYEGYEVRTRPSGRVELRPRE